MEFFEEFLAKIDNEQQQIRNKEVLSQVSKQYIAVCSIQNTPCGYFTLFEMLDSV